MTYSTERPWQLWDRDDAQLQTIYNLLLDNGFEDKPAANLCQATKFFYGLWLHIQQRLEQLDPTSKFSQDAWQSHLGEGCTAVVQGGEVFEKMGVAFSMVGSDQLPEAALSRHSNLAGKPWRAVGVSVVVHPRSPLVPTSHMNVRMLATSAQDTPDQKGWWFGGGYDLTPWIPFSEDCERWHQEASEQLAKFPPNLYPELKAQCDEYFWLPHRKHMRGVGGIFIDDFYQRGFDGSFDVIQGVGQQYIDSYVSIVEKRKDQSFSQAQKEHQLRRRGRYAEFNLLYDRGTKFGLQSSGRIESILMSMPPEAHWDYLPKPTDLEQSYQDYYQPKNWLV